MFRTVRTPSRTLVAALSIPLLLLNQSVFAAGPQQDAASQAMQAAQAAQQMAQQANAQAIAAQQAVAQQAQQAAQQAADAASQAPPPRLPRPASVPTSINGPIPTQIAAAHTVYLTSAPADASFPIDSTQAYNDVYAALQAWGHFQLVPSVAQADLILELRDTDHITDVSGYRGTVTSTSSPAFQLTIIDPHTNVRLWTITSPVYAIGRKQELHRWITLSETNLISRIKVLSGQPLSQTESADLTLYPKTHNTRALLIVGGIAAGAAIGGALAFEHSVSNAKANQDAFCAAHNIPLSMCAGG